jgi:hypothetical protein
MSDRWWTGSTDPPSACSRGTESSRSHPKCKEGSPQVNRQDDKEYKRILVGLMNELNGMESVLKSDQGDSIGHMIPIPQSEVFKTRVPMQADFTLPFYSIMDKNIH